MCYTHETRKKLKFSSNERNHTIVDWVHKAFIQIYKVHVHTVLHTTQIYTDFIEKEVINKIPESKTYNNKYTNTSYSKHVSAIEKKNTRINIKHINIYNNKHGMLESVNIYQHSRFSSYFSIESTCIQLTRHIYIYEYVCVCLCVCACSQKSDTYCGKIKLSIVATINVYIVNLIQDRNTFVFV